MSFNTQKYLWGKINIAKTGTVVLATALTLILPASVFAATIDQLNVQINSVNQQLQQKRNEAASIQNEIAIIDGQLAQVNLQIQATQAQIDQLNQEISDTTDQITQTENDLKAEQEKMKEYLRVMYEDGQVSIVEEIAKSNNFSDFVDQKEYLADMQQKVKETADQIATLKKQLEDKKKQLEGDMQKQKNLQAAQQAQQQAITAQKAYKDQLLAQANASAQGLQSKLSDLNAQKAALSVTYGERLIRGGSSYPYGNPPPAGRIDTPDGYGYLIGECTSYVAWKRASVGRPVPRGLGNAANWVGSATSRYPTPGAVMVFPYVGYYGHVAYVEAVYGNGTILISEYNWTPYSYSSRVVNPYNYGAVFIP